MFKASLPSPAEGESAHLSVAAQVPPEEMDSRRYCGRTDCRDSAHSTRSVNSVCRY